MMGYLRHSDVTALMNCARDLHGLAPGRDFRHRLVKALSGIIPSNYVGIHSINAGSREGEIILYPFGSLTLEDLTAIGRYIYQHPFFSSPDFVKRFVPASAVRSAPVPEIKKSFFRKFQNGGVVTVSDAIPRRARFRYALYADVLGRVGADHSLGISLRSNPGENEVLAISRGLRDFTERERSMLELLAPHILRSMERSDKVVAMLDIMGATVPAGRTLEDFGLTPRETEVLHWVAQGKANADVAEILDMAPRTVKKHLERIFQKLGVENRTAAALMALEAGNGR